MTKQARATPLDRALRGLTVAEVMTRQVIRIDRRSSIADAVATLVTHRIDGAPVVDGWRVVGVISKSDLMYLVGDGGASVERAMTPVVFAVRSTDPVPAAVRMMLTAKVHRALVIDDHQLVGTVSPFDVLAALDRSATEAPAFNPDGSEAH
jgi:predicted transcriptional regulator